jgi:membrane fusion protein, multidrug efflux system
MMSHPPTRALLTSLVLLAACDPGQPPAPPPPEVLVVEVAARDVPVISEWLGTTEGFVDAAVRAQVSGYLIARDYQEGQLVKRGDLLFRIDPRPFQAALDQAQGQLASARATLERERLDVVRYTPLVKQGAVSQQEYDNAVQNERGAQASVQAAQAAVEKAKIDLGFTEIRSPVDGIVGVAQAQLGDFVGPGSAEPMTAVSQLDPIRVSFPVSEQEYLHFAPRIEEALRVGHFREGKLELILADGSIYPHRGTGYPAGLGVDPRTGTITGKGKFPNPRYLLRPGQYARVRLETDVRRGATTVPQRALQDLQGLAQIAVVGPDGKVEIRMVQPGPSSGTLRVIEKGLTPGEHVIVEGFQKVQPGMVVSPKPAPPELAGEPAPSKLTGAAPATAPTPEVAAPPAGLPRAAPPVGLPRAESPAAGAARVPNVSEPSPAAGQNQ